MCRGKLFDLRPFSKGQRPQIIMRGIQECGFNASAGFLFTDLHRWLRWVVHSGGSRMGKAEETAGRVAQAKVRCEGP